MEQRFNDSPPAKAIRDLANQYGLDFSTRGQDDLRLPAAPARSLRHAHPVGRLVHRRHSMITHAGGWR